MAPDDRDVLPDRTRELAGDRDRDAGLGDVLPFPRRRPDRVAAPSPRLRSLIGEVLRDERRDQARTLADVARDAAVSLPYLSEVERGRKEVSSEVLGAICEALDVPLADVLEQVVRRLRVGAQGGSGVVMLAA